MGAVAGFSSLLTPLLSSFGVPGVIGTVASELISQNSARKQARAEQDQALVQLQERQRADEAVAMQNAVLQRKQIEEEAMAAEERRKQALRRAVARQRTLFSAQGLGASAQGSNEAVLLGLLNDSAAEADSAASLDTLKKTALDQGLEQQRQKNLLETTQLAQKQVLSRYLQGY
ncbi:MAG: hypothetical protein KGQ41_01690 [Alphaproteobacteria bacterium]|nr:hypothetical protein [Alphaproteobacteria bacterium]